VGGTARAANDAIIAAVDADTLVRSLVYRTVVERGVPPAISEIAVALALEHHHVRAALTRLAAARMLVLQPSTQEVLITPPFSAVPTQFLVESPRHSAYANCIWDAIGVPIMLGEPAHIVTGCGCCGDAMMLLVDPDQAPADGGIVHFAVPARWWEDIVFT